MLINFGATRFRFEVDESSWCRVFFNGEGGERFLGALSFESLCKRLCSSLEIQDAGGEWEWVLTLSERHHSLYRRATSSGLSFCWRDGKAKSSDRIVELVAEFTMTPNECARTREDLLNASAA